MALPQEKDLLSLKTSQLADVWNLLSDAKVKRFSTKVSAVNRIMKTFNGDAVDSALMTLGLIEVEESPAETPIAAPETEAAEKDAPIERQKAEDVLVHGKQTREQWLNKLAKAMIPQFNALGYKLPRIAISCGFTSSGSRGGVIGECWYPAASEGGITEIFIKPDQVDPIEVAQILCHEMIHASFGSGVGHKKPFADAAKSLGLEGPATATTAGPDFIEWVEPLIEKVGEYPHEKLGSPAKKKQDHVAMINLRCPTDDYLMKVSGDTFPEFTPVCPCCGSDMEYGRKAKKKGKK